MYKSIFKSISQIDVLFINRKGFVKDVCVKKMFYLYKFVIMYYINVVLCVRL